MKAGRTFLLHLNEKDSTFNNLKLNNHLAPREIKRECAGGGSDKPAPEMLQLLSVTMEAIIPEINTLRLTETKNTVEIKVLIVKVVLFTEIWQTVPNIGNGDWQKD